ncbi:hypothetical protein [Paenibacillus crassostreae]|uniref:Uncharacterized protein n=1 Tax=Paenibacillus crassostreae TaxID=1763538 RepID=A0A167EV01_9BACL|nr:hypothetical protein [Paenibacillus crassostreae]AOZ93438.1 hypothetical protein LPB68_15325 [Paenibacillus crassostreae]OAB75907.1 hypothetical protein PNBC_07695 [Paenibacillus crassostreae]
MKKTVTIKRTSAQIKKVRVIANKGKATQNLGDGFFRFVYNRTITPNTFFTFTFSGGTLKPVSGGWWIDRSNSLPAYATANYSLNDNQWVVVVYNPTTVTRRIAFTFIAKT